MSIQLSPEAEAQVNEFVKRGGYTDADSVLDEAPRVLKERDQLDRLRELIAVAEEQAAQGRVSAEDDLRRLLATSSVMWGKEQRDVYVERLMAAMSELPVHPFLGRARDELSPGLSGLRSGAHVIYYRSDERTVMIVRLLHERMDPARHIRPPQ
jgi:toxin ParE1/3/4